MPDANFIAGLMVEEIPKYPSTQNIQPAYLQRAAFLGIWVLGYLGIFQYLSLMLKTGILNPHVLNLLARVRHTNTLVIADRGFPLWPQLETVDLSLVDDVPTVLQVLA